MEQCVLAMLATLAVVVTGVSSISCYQCYINPPLGFNTSTVKRLCEHFDYSERYVEDCPYSTMCVKQDFFLDIQNGVTVHGVVRDCAQQKYEYQSLEGGRWHPKIEVLEPYQEGCQNVDVKGEKVTNTRYCYCKSNLCNSTTKTNHEGYTDIMGVIVVFNLMKYIRSLR